MNHFKKKYLKFFCNVLFAVSEKDATALFHIVRWKVNSVADQNVSQHFHIEMETLGRVFDYIWSGHANVILWCTYTNQRIYVLLSLQWKGKTKSIYVQTRAILSWIISWLYMSEKFENAEATFNQIVFMFLSECNNTNFSLLKIHQNNGNINNSWSFHVKRQKEYLVDIAFLKIIILCSFDSSTLFYFSCLCLNRKKWLLYQKLFDIKRIEW